MQFASDLMSKLGSENPFSLQMDSLDTRFQITLGPIDDAILMFPETTFKQFCS